MSSDDFDPMVERAFSRSPHLADAEDFAKAVETRLKRRGRLRTWALTLAGLVGGWMAVTQSLGGMMPDRAPQTPAVGSAAMRDLQLAAFDAQGSLQAMLDQVGLVDAGATGMSMFWMACAALVATAALGAVKLFQEI